MRRPKLQIAIILFLIAGITYLWITNQRLSKTNELLLQTVVTARDFAKNANESHRTLGECVADYDVCNPQEIKAKLIQLGDENEQIWSQLKEYENQLLNLGVNFNNNGQR